MAKPKTEQDLTAVLRCQYKAKGMSTDLAYRERMHPKGWSLNEALLSLYVVMRYSEGLPKNEVAKRLGLRKQDISGLEAQAKRRLLVNHFFDPPINEGLSADLKGLSSLGEFNSLVVPTAAVRGCNSLVAHAAARQLERLLLRERRSITIGGGATAAETLRSIELKLLQDLALYPAAGGLPHNPWSPEASISGLLGRNRKLEAHFFPPARLTSSGVLERTKASDRTLARAAAADIFLLGIGPFQKGAKLWSMLEEIGTAPEEIMHPRMVGTFGFCAFDRDGKPLYWRLDDIIFKIRSKQVAAAVSEGRDVLVVGRGSEKAMPMLALITGGWANYIVTDEETARAILSKAKRKPSHSKGQREWRSRSKRINAAQLQHALDRPLAQVGEVLRCTGRHAGRLAKQAEEEGLVRHSVNLPPNRILAGKLAARFPSTSPPARVVVTSVNPKAKDPVPSQALRHVAEAGCHYFEMISEDGCQITIDGGSTVEQFIEALIPGLIPNLTVYPIAGGLPHNARNSPESLVERFAGRYGEQAGIKPRFYPSPLQVGPMGDVATRQKEELQKKAISADVFLMGVGSNHADSTLWAVLDSLGRDPSAYLGPEVAATFAYALLDDKGEPIVGENIDKRLSCISPYSLRNSLKKGRHVLVMAQGEKKARAITAIVRGGWCSFLVIDEIAARAVLDRLASQEDVGISFFWEKKKKSLTARCDAG